LATMTMGRNKEQKSLADTLLNIWYFWKLTMGFTPPQSTYPATHSRNPAFPIFSGGNLCCLSWPWHPHWCIFFQEFCNQFISNLPMVGPSVTATTPSCILGSIVIITWLLHTLQEPHEPFKPCQIPVVPHCTVDLLALCSLASLGPMYSLPLPWFPQGGPNPIALDLK
jgi:hypothetical protein